MRVAQFVQRYPPALGGSESYFYRLSRYLSQQSDAVTVWTTTALDLDSFWSPRGRVLSAGESIEDGVVVRRFPLWRMRGRRWVLKPLSLIPQRTWQALTLPCNPVSFAMRRAVERSEEKYDAVHAGAFPYAWPIVCARRLARRLDVPFFLTPFLHLGDPDNPRDPVRRAYTSRPFRSLLQSADGVFVQTERELSAVKNLGVPQNRIYVQGLGVDASECTGGSYERARSKWKCTQDEIVIGHLANNSAEKGTIDLVKAAEQLWSRGQQFRLVLAGPEMPNFRRFMSGIQSDRIIRLGWLSDRERRDFFAGIDVFALPSRSDSFGLVLLEAWANHVPVVVYRAGGPAELVRHGIDGLQAPCGDIESLADQLERMIIDAELRAECGIRGCERIDREFRWHDKLELFRKKIGPGRQPGPLGDFAEGSVLRTKPTSAL
jgi:glycosyltransferase involved in cell wall biosynthesis